MKQVNKDEFYAVIGDLDCVAHIDESYSAIYTMRHTNTVIGKSIESANTAEASIGEGQTYFIKG